MELKDISVEARNVRAGSQSFDVTAGQTLKMETSPQGIDVLNLDVPAGKKWRVEINVQITESDE